MAYFLSAAIRRAIREVIEDNHGLVRKIAANTYEGQIYEGLPDDEQSRLAIVKPRVESIVKLRGLHPASPPINGTQGLRRFDVRVNVVRQIDASQRVSDSARDAAQSLADTDGDIIAQALTYPSALRTTATGTATGIVSGCLTWANSDVLRFSLPAEGTAGLIETVHTFEGVANVSQAIT